MKFDFLTFVNALEFALSSFAVCIFAAFIIWKAKDMHGIYAHFRKALDPNFRGGPYDLVMALSVVFLGLMVRREAVWESLAFSQPLRLFQIGIGVCISTIGLLCLIRVISESAWLSKWWPAVLFIAGAFSLWSAIKPI